MGRIHAKRIEPVAYYLYRDAKSYQAGKPALHTKFGPYASMKEADAKREEEESGGLPGYEYHYRIAAEPILIPKIAHYPERAASFMATIALSDKQHVSTQSIEKAELFGDHLLITYKNGDHIKVHGPGTTDDANLLDEVREREQLSYSVFRTAKSKLPLT